LKLNDHPNLQLYKVDEKERQYRVWQRDPMAILIDNKKKVEQKLDYIHLNPLQEKWNLVSSPEHYQWSSAKFYESENEGVDLLTHYMDRF